MWVLNKTILATLTLIFNSTFLPALNDMHGFTVSSYISYIYYIYCQALIFSNAFWSVTHSNKTFIHSYKKSTTTTNNKIFIVLWEGYFWNTSLQFILGYKLFLKVIYGSVNCLLQVFSDQHNEFIPYLN